MHATISISEQNYDELTEIKIDLMKKQKPRKDVSFNDVISELIRVYKSKPRLI